MIVKITKLLGLLAFSLMSGCISDNNRSGAYKKSSTTCSAINPMKCSNRQLCNSLTIVSMKAEARMRALKCVQQPKVQKSKVANKVVVANAVKDSKTSNVSEIKIPKTSNITKSIEDGLNRIGCNVGKADGIIDNKTRAGLYRFTSKVGIDFKLKFLEDRNFLELIKSYPTKTCTNAGTSTTVDVKKTPPVTNPKPDNSAELRQLRQERELLEANLLATQQLMEQQKRAAERPYKACVANCQLNNKAGKGFAALMSGMAQCYSSCAPLKWGGTVVPPTWDRDVKQLKRYDCMITKLNRNQASVDCNQF
jgi:hypothetical protein